MLSWLLRDDERNYGTGRAGEFLTLMTGHAAIEEKAKT